MDLSHTHSVSNRCNFLALDGGGVRGLSSLLILQALMEHINSAIQTEAPGARTLHPQDVFDLVSGTSTGGLIAIMIGKLGMTVEECIQAYNNFSRSVFGEKRKSRGAYPTVYSDQLLEDCIKDIMREKGFEEVTPMVSNDSRDKTSCVVVCRELIGTSVDSGFKLGPVLICSVPCDENDENDAKIEWLVTQAARATSAAPIYFSPQIIGDRYFVDGAVRYNNPSMATYDHYTGPDRIAAVQRLSQPSDTEPHHRHYHANVDTRMLRFVNLGTGNTQPRRMTTFARRASGVLAPYRIRTLIDVWETLIHPMFDAQSTADDMEKLASISRGSETCDFTWHRFSAGKKVGNVRLDKHSALFKIKKSTLRYLAKGQIQEELKRVAREIATEYLQKEAELNLSNIGTEAGTTVLDYTAPSDDTMALEDSTWFDETTRLLSATSIKSTAPSNDATPSQDPMSFDNVIGLLKPTPIDSTAPIADAGSTDQAMSMRDETPNSQVVPDLSNATASRSNPSSSDARETGPHTPARQNIDNFDDACEVADEEPSPMRKESKNPSSALDLERLKAEDEVNLAHSLDQRPTVMERFRLACNEAQERTAGFDQSH